MSSSFLVRWVKRFLAVLAVGQVMALAIGGAALVASPAGEHTAETADAPTPPPGSSTTTTSTGASPPVVTSTIGGTLGAHDWYTSDVAVSFAVSDEETPVSSQSGCDPQNVTADTAEVTFACTATSDGGSTTSTVKIARDATAPVDVAVSADRAPDHDPFYTAPFTATWTATDATSGIQACHSETYSGPDTTTGELSGTCTDWAGNESAPAAFPFQFDATAPGVTGTPDRGPDHGDWYNHSLTITWSSDDPAATCEPAESYGGPGADDATASAEGNCTDSAGNVGVGTFDFKYDETAPEITLVAPADGGSYILNQPVEADYACTDATAGIETCDGPAADGTPIDTGSVGAKTFAVDAMDQAGNTASSSAGYTVTYSPAGVSCGGVAGHEILQPIAADGSSSFQKNSTVPAKFRVCDFFGTPVTTPDVVTSFSIVSPSAQPVTSTSAHDGWRAGAAQWIFNIATKPLSAGTTYGFEIGLNDGTTIGFSFLVR
jgi:hypothetical protein